MSDEGDFNALENYFETCVSHCNDSEKEEDIRRLYDFVENAVVKLNKIAKDKPDAFRFVEKEIVWPALISKIKAAQFEYEQIYEKVGCGGFFNLQNKKTYEIPKQIAIEFIRHIHSIAPQLTFSSETVPIWQELISDEIDAKYGTKKYLLEKYIPKHANNILKQPNTDKILTAESLLKRKDVQEYCQRTFSKQTQSHQSIINQLKQKILKEVKGLAPKRN